ncbi:MAG: hypothetical protein ACSW75_00940 [Lachnospiraceae bacterium]
MNRKILAFFLGLTLAGSVFVGCGNKEQGASEGSPARASVSSGQSESSFSSLNDSASSETEDSSSDLPPEGTPVPAPEDSLPDYLAGTTDVRDESAAAYNPEGLAAIPGEEIQLKDTAVKLPLKETVRIPSSLGSYELTVDSAALTDERIESIPADKVLRITFTYANIDYDADLLVSSLFFRLCDSEGKACAPYILGDKERSSVKPLKVGKSCTANFYYILPEDSTSTTLVFDDILEESGPSEYYWELKV